MQDDFAKRFEASRRFEHELNGVLFQFRRPDEHTVRKAYEANRIRVNGEDLFLESRAAREILNVAIVGWSDLRQSILDHSVETDALLHFSVINLKLLLDNRQDLADELAGIVIKNYNEHRLSLEVSVKKSETP